jgi:perosamine synthetase
VKELPLTVPFVGPDEAAAAAKVLSSGWLTQGPRVAEFEQAFARRVGAPHACAVANCTAALQSALLAVGVSMGDVVITASHSFIATANAIRACGAEPVFVDIDLETFNLSPTALAEALASDFEQRDQTWWYGDVGRLAVADSPLARVRDPRGRLAAILVVHQVGMPADLAAILAQAADLGLPVVEDAACAIGSQISFDHGHSWQAIGRPHGDVACFSLHPRKVITTGEGGMLTTASAAVDRQLRLLRQHGMSVSDLIRHQADRAITEHYLCAGFNFRMTDIQAAVGSVQLGKLDTIVARRRQLAARYAEGLAAVAGITPPVEPAYARTNWQSYVALLADAGEQERISQSLRDDGIATRKGVMCAHLEPVYARAWAGTWASSSLPNSEQARHRGLVLPLFPAMSTDDVDRVVESLSRHL